MRCSIYLIPLILIFFYLAFIITILSDIEPLICTLFVSCLSQCQHLRSKERPHRDRVKTSGNPFKSNPKQGSFCQPHSYINQTSNTHNTTQAINILFLRFFRASYSYFLHKTKTNTSTNGRCKSQWHDEWKKHPKEVIWASNSKAWTSQGWNCCWSCKLCCFHFLSQQHC